MLFDFKVCDRLVFNDRDISNFCKSFVYLKAIAEKDAALRERLANGFRPWDLEGGINATFMFYPDWFDIDSTNRLSKPNVAREFNKFLGFHTDKTFRNDLFSVERYDDLGLGLKSKVRIPVDDFAEECPGYLEFIGEDLFDALHHLGYNSLFTYLDKHNERQFCILYGPLSLINADEFCEVGFTWRGPDADEFLYENQFHEAHVRELVFPGTPDEMEVEQWNYWFTQRVFHPSYEQFYSSTKYTKLHNLDPPIVFKQIKKELLVGIDLHYYGNPHGLHPGRDHFVEGEQILINYDWRNPKAV